MIELPKIPEQLWQQWQEMRRMQEEAERMTGISMLLPLNGTVGRAATAYDQMLEQARHGLRNHYRRR